LLFGTPLAGAALPKKKKINADVANLFAGQLGVSAVLANVLIDKGIVSRAELYERLQQAHDAARESAGGEQAARLLAAMMSYVGKKSAAREPH
jgi:hypothetical protein